tara:strand:- start:1169 stop:2959 length:1791 start_codon:yes stop_codon:yes gene_type:complete
MSSYYVCNKDGNDENVGSEISPFKTINKASFLAKPGDTIIVKPGIYRERVIPNKSGYRSNPITYKSLEKHKAIIRGSIEWKPEKEENNLLIGPLDSSVFTDDSHYDGANPFLIKCCVTPFKREGAPETKIKEIRNSDPNMFYCLGQVFVDDEMYLQCPYKDEMEKKEKSWFYDSSQNLLYVNGANKSQNIEITNQRRLFAPHRRGLKHIIVDGFIIERCGNQYPNRFWVMKSHQQSGAIGVRSGKYWQIRNNIIRYANTIGIDWGNEGKSSQDLEKGFNGKAIGSYGHLIENNIICDNGGAGTAAYMSNKFIFRNNIVERNNNLRFFGKQRWESAGVKVHRPKNSIFSNNIVRNNYSHGFWSDQGAGVNSLFEKNIILNNEKSGVEFEIGRNEAGKVVNNIFEGNDYGVRFATSGGVLVSNNLFLNSKTSDVKMVIFKRPDKWDSLNVEVFYNMFLNSPQFLQITPPDDTPKFLASRYFNYNTYVMHPKDKKFHIKFDYKTKINTAFLSWQDMISDLNNDVDCDDKSVIQQNIKSQLYLDDNVYKLNMNISTDLIKFPITNKMGSKKDYFNKEWKLDNVISGPFRDLTLGENKFVL